MNKLYIVLHLIVLLVLSSFALADLSINLAHVIDFSETSGELTDKIAEFDSLNNSITDKSNTGINGNAWDFERDNNDYVDFSPPNSGLVNGSDPVTYAFWLKPETIINTHIFFQHNNFGTGGMRFTINANKLSMIISNEVKNGVKTLDTGVWQLVVISLGQGTAQNQVTFWVNNTLDVNTTETLTDISLDENIAIGSLSGGAGNSFDGLIDEFYIWNRTFSQTDVDNLWKGGVGNFSPYDGAPPAASTATPTIIAPSPVDNANNNTNVTLNVSHSTGNNDVRYYLYFGESSPLDESNLYVDNETRTAAEHKEFLTNVSDGTYFYKWKVQNVTNGIFSFNTTQRTWNLDTVSPTITLKTGTNFSIDNSTILSPRIQNLSINISFFDSNLAGGQTLINITNSTDESVFSVLNTSITGTTVNVSRIVDISTLALGSYTIKLIATDSHTAKKIKDYGIVSGLSYFRYTTQEGNIIKITSDTLPLTRRTNKLTDRYDFEFNYLFQKNTYKFTIESINKIRYIDKSKVTVGPHFVIMSSDGNGNWLDFENPNLKKGDYKVTKIDDYIYEIEITAKGLKSFKFSSLGGLNRIEQDYKIQLGAIIDVWVFDEENYPRQLNTTVTIGNQVANSSVNVSGARLINITKDITTLTLTSAGFGTEVKDITITQSFHNFSFNMSPVSAAKFFFFDEKSEQLIEGETFSLFLEKTGFSQTFTGITGNPHSITTLDLGSYKIKASSTNYPERQYLDLVISNITTTNLNLYLINSTLGSSKTFNIVDEGLNPLENVRTVFTKIINGTATVIAEEDSDFAGQVILTLDSNTQYKINFSKTNYEDQTINLEPKNSEYVIKMISTIGKYNQSVYEGIRYRFEPSNTVLNNNTKYNFTFTLNSSVWAVTNCTLTLKNGTNTLGQTSSFTTNSCFLRIEQDTFTMTNITSEAIYELDSQFNFTVTQQYAVIYTYKGEFSLKNFLDDLSDFGMAGFDSFGRMMLALIVIFIITSLAAQKVGFTNPEILIFLVIAQVWFFSSVNWLFLDFTPIPTIAGFNLKKYIIAILITLGGGAFIIEKFSK